MAFSEFEEKKIQKILGQYLEKNRPQPEIRDKVDLWLNHVTWSGTQTEYGGILAIIELTPY